MRRVVGIGGIFFKSKDPKKLAEWYRERLGIPIMGDSAVFSWRWGVDDSRLGHTVWALFPKDTKYFGDSQSQFMLNYRVKDLRQTLKELKEEGVEVDEKTEEYDYGKFGWITDPEGNRIELWQPPEEYLPPEGSMPSE